MSADTEQGWRAVDGLASDIDGVLYAVAPGETVPESNPLRRKHPDLFVPTGSPPAEHSATVAAKTISAERAHEMPAHDCYVPSLATLSGARTVMRRFTARTGSYNSSDTVEVPVGVLVSEDTARQLIEAGLSPDHLQPVEAPKPKLKLGRKREEDRGVTVSHRPLG